MAWLLGIGLLFLVATLVWRMSLSPEERARMIREDAERRQRKRQRADASPPVDLADELANDPVGALSRYGTPEDAARLTAQGIDLEALGYRPPGEDPAQA